MHDFRSLISLLLLACLTGCGDDAAPPKPNNINAQNIGKYTPADGGDDADRTLAVDAIKKLHAAIKARNPDYVDTGEADTGEADVTPEGEIVELSLREAKVSDLSALAGLKLRLLDLFGTPVSDLSALKGMPLHGLYLEETRVTDLAPLAGAPIVELYLSKAPVSDLSPLRGMQITSLNLLGTRVSDLSPLEGMPLSSLWLNSTPVSDLTPLKNCRTLQSLTLYGTHVTDLSPLASLLQLQRLHIGNTKITDLRPLAHMNLARLIFDPAKIEHGLDAVREMPNMQEIGPDLETRMTPLEFWRRYDAGEFK